MAFMVLKLKARHYTDSPTKSDRETKEKKGRAMGVGETRCTGGATTDNANMFARHLFKRNVISSFIDKTTFRAQSYCAQ